MALIKQQPLSAHLARLFLLLMVVGAVACRRETSQVKPTPQEAKKTAKKPEAPKPGAPPEAGSLPDVKLTPGATLDVTKDDICTPGYSKKVRNVPASVKKRVYAEYNVQYVPRAYEVDHLISLELGGSNSIRNLWPESYSIHWSAYVKDALENRLHSLVCNGQVNLPDAQHEIATDWISSYKKYFQTEQPLAKHSRRR